MPDPQPPTSPDAGPPDPEQAWWDPGEPYWATSPPPPGEGGEPAPFAPPGPPPGYPAGPPPAFPPPPPQPAKAGPGRGVVVAVVAAVAAIALAAGASVVLLGSDSGPDHPDRWDARVAPIAGWVEDERDLAFDTPVHVDFLTPAQYRAQATEPSAGTTAADRRMLEQYAGAYRAIGLAEGEVDLFDSLNEVSDSGTLAFYDPADERIRVRGTELTPSLRVTLAHELTHALQDQHFDLDRIYEDTDDLQPDSYDTQLRAVVEGDAERIEGRYVDDQLTLAEREVYEAQAVDEGEAATDQLEEESVPPGLLATFAAPYWFGSRFVSLVEQERGSAAVDDAIRIPPSSSEQMFDPLTYLRGDRPVGVDAVRVPAGAQVVDRGPFGSVQWFVMLAERIKPEIALRAVDGWGGDAQAVWEDDGEVCVGANFSGDTPEDDDEMYGALTRWADALPDAQVEVEQGAGIVSFESCDPGAGAELEVTGRSGDALAYPAVRTDIATAALADGAEPEVASCFGTQVVAALTVEQLLGGEEFFASKRFERIVAEANLRCR